MYLVSSKVRKLWLKQVEAGQSSGGHGDLSLTSSPVARIDPSDIRRLINVRADPVSYMCVLICIFWTHRVSWSFTSSSSRDSGVRLQAIIRVFCWVAYIHYIMRSFLSMGDLWAISYHGT